MESAPQHLNLAANTSSHWGNCYKRLSIWSPAWNGSARASVPQRVSYKWPFFDELMVWRSILFPAVTLHPGMCRSKAVCVRERDSQKDIHTKSQREKDRKFVFLMVELQLRFSQGHSLTYDIHGARLSLSLGRSPSAPTDKTRNFMCSRQTPRICIVWI